jgi:hypothetical protein
MSESNDNAQLILDAISDLRQHIDHVVEQLETRVRTVEGSVAKIHTYGSVFGLSIPVFAFFGWATVKAWLLAVMRS